MERMSESSSTSSRTRSSAGAEVLLAFEQNGEALDVEQGGPLRLVPLGSAKAGGVTSAPSECG